MNKSRGAKPGAGRERIQKLLAAAGLGSRRGLEKRIEAGEILLNGSAATLGATASVGDMLTVNDSRWRVVSATPRHRTLIYNKPPGEVTTRSDPQGRPTVFDRMPRLDTGRWIAIGRLDVNTSGLLLMTTDGELAHAMMHPSNLVDREYACRILGEADGKTIERLKSGVDLEDGPACFSDIVASGGTGENKWYYVTLLEGRNREVRRLWASQGLTVSRLKRVRYGAAFLPEGLKMGEFTELSRDDHRVLREDVGLPPVESTLMLEPADKDRPQNRRRRKRRRNRK